jgi:PLD-like domain
VSGIGLYANRNSRGDFVINALQRLTDKPCNVYAAVAFFTDASVIEDFIARGCAVRLIVRLGYPTSADALERLISNSGVQIRYFTDHAFHPKLYIFGDSAALVGSANLTRSAIVSNQEVVVKIDSSDVRMNELAGLFGEYWSQARVLTTETIKTYQVICARFRQLQVEQSKLDQEVLAKLGKVVAGDINKDATKDSAENIFLEAYRKSYQESVSAFNLIRSIYERVGQRKIAEATIPLRLEIDSFISFVREQHASADKWMEAPLRSGAEQESYIEVLIREWIATTWPYFTETVVQNNYPRLLAVVARPETIMAASDSALFEALCSVHAFNERLRFFLGGLPSWKVAFQKANDPKRTRESLVYLLHGPGSVEERLANVIYGSKHKLNEFGQSSAQELIGWYNKEDLPVVNGRTTKVLRYLGFDIRQI